MTPMAFSLNGAPESYNCDLSFRSPFYIENVYSTLDTNVYEKHIYKI